MEKIGATRYKHLRSPIKANGFSLLLRVRFGVRCHSFSSPKLLVGLVNPDHLTFPSRVGVVVTVQQDYQNNMAAPTKDNETTDPRLLRKRLAARLRQQRCRARKRAALMTKKQEAMIKKEFAPGGKKMPPMSASSTKKLVPNYHHQHYMRPHYMPYPPPPPRHMTTTTTATPYPPPPPPNMGRAMQPVPNHYGGGVPQRVHVTISYEGHPPRSFPMMAPPPPPPPHHAYHHMQHAAAVPTNLPSRMVSRTVSEEESSLKKAKASPVDKSKKQKKGTPLATKEKAAIDAMLSLVGSTSSESEEESKEESFETAHSDPPSVVYATMPIS